MIYWYDCSLQNHHSQVMLPETINRKFQYACMLDVAALKPGNIGWHGGDGGITARDFVLSAAACGSVLCAANQTLGQRILRAIQQTRKQVGHNTNLGIVLLCAPVVEVALKAEAGALRDLTHFRAQIKAVLQAATQQDTEAIFSAIRLANPGGMGRVAEDDIADSPTRSLVQIMDSAKEYDQIAAQYSNTYRLLFEYLIPALIEIHRRWGYDCWSMTGIYLQMLGNYPDSLVHRKYGQNVACAVMQRSKPLAEMLVQSKRPQQFEQELIVLDRSLKEQRINPGTTADLVVCGFFMAGLGKILC